MGATVHETEGVSAPLQIRVYRVAPSAGQTKFIVLAPATDGTRQAFNLQVPSAWSRVDNGRYAYLLSVCQDSDGTFHGARVKYTYTSAGARQRRLPRRCQDDQAQLRMSTEPAPIAAMTDSSGAPGGTGRDAMASLIHA